MSRTTTAPEAAYPRVTIEYCTKCKWMLRAAYFAQELLSTFQASLAEVSLRPSLKPGTFIVTIAHVPEQATPQPPPRPHQGDAAHPPSQEAQREDLQVEALDDQNASVQDAPDPTTTATAPATTQTVLLWDRTVDGGFPETKELKRRVRDVIEPGRNLGHNERGGAATGTQGVAAAGDAGSHGQAAQPRHTGKKEEPTTTGTCAPGQGCGDCA